MLIAAVIFAFALLTGRAKWSRGVLAVAVIVAATYLGVMLIFSFSSSDQLLARGQEKHFCEIDCHLANSIVDVQRTKLLGNRPNQTAPAGNFLVVTI